MRKKIIAGNWKMNLDYADAMTLAKSVAQNIPVNQLVQVILAPPFVYLHEIVNLVLDHHSISVASQNCSDKNAGAYTGDVAASMLASIGVEYVMIGHSERRIYFDEDNELLSKKVAVALDHLLLPVYCCGESLDQRNSLQHLDIIRDQIEVGLFHLDNKKAEQCTIAYEPVWAIGTGMIATAAQIQEMHLFIRSLIKKKYGDRLSENISILYGGSITPQNASNLFSCPDVDGGLVGGASLKAVDFLEIIDELEKAEKKK